MHFINTRNMVTSSDPMVAFKDADYALLVGFSSTYQRYGAQRPVLEVNGGIFIGQGKALAAVAKKDVKF